MRRFISINLIISTLLICQSVPVILNYQGSLQDDSGDPVTGEFQIQVGIYTQETGGSNFWTEVHNPVSVNDGIFHLLLGSVNPLPDNIFNSSDRWITISVNGDGWMSPRTRIASVPYAMIAGNAGSENQNIIAGNGLAGGGSGDAVTLAVNAGSGISVGPDIVALDIPWTDSRYMIIGQSNTVSTGMVIPDIISSVNGVSNDGGNIDILPGSNISITPDNETNSITISASDGNGIEGSGAGGYIPLFTNPTSLTNSMMRQQGNTIIIDEGTRIEERPRDGNPADRDRYLNAMDLYGEDGKTFFAQVTETNNGSDGRSAIYGFRTRTTQNNGSGYDVTQTNNAITGFNNWGDLYTFGVAGYTYGDFTQTGGVLGYHRNSHVWGSLGYEDENQDEWGLFTPHDAKVGGRIYFDNSLSLQSSEEFVDILHLNSESFGIISGIHLTNTNTGSSSGDGIILYQDSNNNATLFNLENAGLFFGSNGTDAMMVSAAGKVGIGTNSPEQKLHVTGQAYIDGYLGVGTTMQQSPISVYTNNDNNGIFSQNDANNSNAIKGVAESENSSTGIYGLTYSDAGFGVAGHNLSTGAGIGAFGDEGNIIEGYDLHYSSHYLRWYVTENGWSMADNGHGTFRSNRSGSDVHMLYGMASPEAWFEDFGTDRLRNGTADIQIEPLYAEMISTSEDYHVYLTALGDEWNLLRVTKKLNNSFVVEGVKLDGSPANCEFDYRIVAKQVGYEQVRLETVDIPEPVEVNRGNE